MISLGGGGCTFYRSLCQHLELFGSRPVELIVEAKGEVN